MGLFGTFTLADRAIRMNAGVVSAQVARVVAVFLVAAFFFAPKLNIPWLTCATSQTPVVADVENDDATVPLKHSNGD